MLKILNLLPIKIISATINHLPSISATYFYGSVRQQIQKRTKELQICLTEPASLLTWIWELENEKVYFRFPYRVKTGEIERLYDKY